MTRRLRIDRAIHADELGAQLGHVPDGGMNSRGVSLEVRVEGADDNAGVFRILSVQSDEVAPVQGMKPSEARTLPFPPCPGTLARGPDWASTKLRSSQIALYR